MAASSASVWVGTALLVLTLLALVGLTPLVLGSLRRRRRRQREQEVPPWLDGGSDPHLDRAAHRVMDDEERQVYDLLVLTGGGLQSTLAQQADLPEERVRLILARLEAKDLVIVHERASGPYATLGAREHLL